MRLAKKLLSEGSFYGAVVVLVTFAAFPFYWMLITTFKTDGDLYDLKSIPYWFNTSPTLEHLKYLFQDTLFVQWVTNSALIGLCVVAITLVAALPAGYSLARMTGRSGEALGIGIFLTYLVPPTLLFLPLSRVVSQLGLQDTVWSLVVVYPTFTIPFCTWLMMGFFKTLPRELEEAAWVDGCGVAEAIMHVVVPLSRPAVAITAIFAFTLSMQDYLYAVAYVVARDQMTAPVGLVTALIRGDIYYWGSLMAAALVIGLPVAILYALFIDYFVRGLTGASAA